ncbi:MAG: hypothetical protein Q8Q52_02925, partial [Acidimicrobiia bacterium]|nr:hypothetical protein [Acidimicrobiia bacterium]
MSGFADFLRGDTNIDFVGKRRTWFRVSAIAVIVSAAALVVRDLNLGIEFRGGLSITAENPADASLADLRAVTSAASIADVVIQMVDDGAAVRVQTPALGDDRQEALVDQVALVTGSPRTEISVDA